MLFKNHKLFWILSPGKAAAPGDKTGNWCDFCITLFFSRKFQILFSRNRNFPFEKVSEPVP